MGMCAELAARLLTQEEFKDWPMGVPGSSDGMGNNRRQNAVACQERLRAWVLRAGPSIQEQVDASLNTNFATGLPGASSGSAPD